MPPVQDREPRAVPRKKSMAGRGIVSAAHRSRLRKCGAGEFFGAVRPNSEPYFAPIVTFPYRGVVMRFRFSGQAEPIGSTGNFQIHAFAGDLPVRCVVERGAVTAGFAEPSASDAEVMELFTVRSLELELVASQRFFNGERSPVIKRQHMVP